MSRQVKNAKDIVTGELVYFVSHAKATYLGDGSTVEDTVNVMKRDIKNITLSTEATPMVSVTYEELKNLRDNGKLVAGQQYRITDYVTTTTQENTRSAGHQFDVIVTADNENTLNEVARACLIDINIENYDSAYSPSWDEYLEYCDTYEYNGKVYYRYRSHHLHVLIDFNETIKNIIPTEDYPYYIAPSYVVEHVDREPEDINWNSYKNSTKTIAFKYDPRLNYFNNSNLAAWQIWYSLDNDAERFAWAKPSLYSPITNLKMIIVNDGGETYIYVRDSSYDSDGKCAWLYDFNTESNTSFIDYIKINNESLNPGDIIYTDSEELKVGAELDMMGAPVVLDDMSWIEGKGVIYRMIDEWNNDCPYDFKNIELYRDYSWKKTFSISSNSCTNNTINSFYESGTMMIPSIIFSFESYCHNNVIKSNCNNILFGGITGQGTNLMNNTIGYGCYNLYINCYDIHDNIFGDYCNDFAIQSQTFNKNKIGLRCSDIQISCYIIENTTIGSDCSLITDYNSSDLKNCTIGDFCTNLHVGGTDVKIGNNCTNSYIDGIGCKIGNNCSTIYIFGDHVIGNNCNNIKLSHTKSRYNTNFVGDNCYLINTKGAQMNHCHFGSGCNNINTVAGCSADCVIFENGTRNINVSLYSQLGDEQIIKSGNYNGKFLSNYTLREYPCSYATITYDNLITLRDNENLTKGAKYRIIDYVTSTSQKNTKSAEHRFDIIVTALNEYTLSEEAQAIQNYDEGYFDESNLSAWKIWYSLDNDTDRFEWAGDERIETTTVETIVADSSECTIKSELIDGNTFITPFNFESCVWVDANGDGETYADEFNNNHDINELIYEWGYFTDENDNTHLCLYKSDADLYEEEGQPDYGDKYLYRGVIDVDGTDYDYWQKWDANGDANGDGLDVQGNGDYVFATTARIVSNPEAYSYETTTETIETVIPLEPKGVIYRMIDEWGNDCPYDFKNILFIDNTKSNIYVETQFYESWWAGKLNRIQSKDIQVGPHSYKYAWIVAEISGPTGPGTIYYTDSEMISSSETLFYEYDGYNWVESTTLRITNLMIGTMQYTFGTPTHSKGHIADCIDNTVVTVEGYISHDNTMGAWIDGAAKLNFNCFGNGCSYNSFGNNCYSNLIGNDCSYNSFGNNCYSNWFKNYCNYNTFGNICYNNTFGINCIHNTFGNDCDYNSFGQGCAFNSFDDYCDYNSLGNNCNANSFGKVCSSNSLGNSCSSNSLDYGCSSNSLGKVCSYNSLGANCESNSLGDYCYYNSFGQGCAFNSLGINCYYNSFGQGCLSNSFILSSSTTSPLKGYCCHNHINDGCSYNLIWNSDTASTSNLLQNINVNRGISGNASSYNFININTLNAEYEIKVAKNSKGEIKIYCEADLIK